MIRLPVNPEELPEPGERQQRIQCVGGGPHYGTRIPRLKTVSISGLLPQPPGGWLGTYKGGFEPPEFYITFLKGP